MQAVEPFARDDYESPAKLARMVDMPITGGEGYSSLEPFRQCLLHQTYDILQPDGRTAPLESLEYRISVRR